MKYATVCDSGGLWVELACALAREGVETNYYSPWESAFVGVKQVAPGFGLEDEGVTRIDNPFDGSHEGHIWIFPWLHQEALGQYFGDVTFGATSKGATYLERDRDLLDRILKEFGLPIPDTEIVTGVMNLIEHLADKDECFVKVSNFRDDVETWHHDEFTKTIIQAAEWLKQLGPFADKVPFRVQKPIDAEVEVGLDTFFCGGQFLAPSVIGYECKDKLYAGRVTKELPDMIYDASHALEDYLRAVYYNNFISTEMRITKDGTAYMTDVTTRCPIPPGAAMIYNLNNLSQIIENGSHGKATDIDWVDPYIVEVIISSSALRDDWLEVRFDPEWRRAVCMRNFCKVDGKYWIAPHPSKMTSMISVTGRGPTLADAKELARHVAEDLCKHTYQASFDASAFDEIDKTIEKGVRLGIEF